jgi:hypothetical protein
MVSPVPGAVADYPGRNPPGVAAVIIAVTIKGGWHKPARYLIRDIPLLSLLPSVDQLAIGLRVGPNNAKAGSENVF